MIGQTSVLVLQTLYSLEIVQLTTKTFYTDKRMYDSSWLSKVLKTRHILTSALQKSDVQWSLWIVLLIRHKYRKN